MGDLTEAFGCNVFNDTVMREKLPEETYKALRETIDNGAELNLALADSVAAGMKEWALEKGVTWYTHWFQPMTGSTAEKHDSFISPGGGGKAVMEFSGRELIKGEPDASSFPSGGLRATFEARGYTAWDPTSPAFIKGDVLCIPTAFCSYSGAALDKKTPLLRSMQAVGRQALRVVRLFGQGDVKSVQAAVGAEQEYFLIDKALFEQRRDLMFTGRTLFGAPPPKGQELEDHYYGAIKPRVADFMRDLDCELYKLGVFVKTEHNEVAPGQHELAPIYTTVNISADHNQVIMESLRRVASRHGFVCVLHEKPFAGLNGSGKHINWSLQTDTGQNLLNPGKSPSENAQFLLILSAVLAAVDDYAELLRLTVASAGNDHRLGMDEAPPSIMSVFLGDELTAVLDSIENCREYSSVAQCNLNIGVSSLPPIPKDTTDRNRTSPFAFTGNKFEFRMPGSAFSIACPCYVLNAIVADKLELFADELERAEDFNGALNGLLRRTVTEHKRIVFNGNSYSKEWAEEAARRGLPNLRTTADALPEFVSEKNVALLERQKVLTRGEIYSRYEILLKNYCKVITIEGKTMTDIALRDILPAALSYMRFLSESLSARRAIFAELCDEPEGSLLAALSPLASALKKETEALSATLAAAASAKDAAAHSALCRDEILPAMARVRAAADALETLTAAEFWPFPTYGELLYSN